MSVAPHSGIIDFGTFTSPSGPTDGIQGEVPAPLSGQENYVLTGNGWSSLAALGALSYQGTWNAATNTPTLVSSVGTQGYYYVVSVAGSTNLNGITTWDVGDWVVFNGSTWQKIEGGTVGTFTNVITPAVTAPTNDLTLSAISTGAVKFNTLGGTQAQVIDQSSADLVWSIKGGSSSLAARATFGTNSGAPNFYATGNTIIFTTNGANNADALRISHTASAVNYVQVSGGATGQSSLALRPRIQVQGSDASVGLTIDTKGSGAVDFTTNSNNATSFRVFLQDSPVNYFQVRGSSANIEPVMSVLGSDTNISMGLQSKGTGAIDLAAGSSGVNISNGGTVTAITRTGAGTGYTTPPTVAISAPTTAGGVQATATVTIGLVSVTSIANGGTGYTVNDVLTVSGGTFTVACQVTVTAVSGGVITGVSVTTGGAYTVAPTNPVSVTGGSGSGATFNLSFGITTSFTITNAGSGYIEQPTVTFSGGGGSGAAAFARVGSPVTVTALGTQINFNTENGTGFRVLTSGATATDMWQAISNGNTAILRTSAGSANGQVQTGGTGGLQLGTNQGVTQCLVSHTASAVNYVQVTGGATGAAPVISPQGSDANIQLNLIGKGNAQVVSRSWFTAAQASNNHWQMAGAGAGSSPVLSVLGSDTNIDLSLTTKGTGALNVNTGSGIQFKVIDSTIANVGTTGNYWQMMGRISGAAPILSAGGADTNISPLITAKGTGSLRFLTGGDNSGLSAVDQFRVSHTASAVNYVQVTGAATTATPTISAQGSDTNINLNLNSKGTGALVVNTNGRNALAVSAVATGAPNFIAITNGNTGVAPAITVSSFSTDTNVDLALTPKGTGKVVLTNGLQGGTF